MTSRASWSCIGMLCLLLITPAPGGVLFELTDLKNVSTTGSATCAMTRAPGGKAGNALRVFTPGDVKDSTAEINPSVPLAPGVTVTFRIYVASYTGSFQAVYNHPPGEGLRLMPGGILQGSCGESLSGSWKEKTWYSVALVLLDPGGIQLFMCEGAQAALDESHLLGTICGNNRPMARTTIFNYGGELYIADYTINDGFDLTLEGTTAATRPRGPAQPPGRYVLPLTITSTLPFPGVPMDPAVPFGRIIQQANIQGVLDQNSIAVRDGATGRTVRHAIERFNNTDTLNVEWVIEDPGHRAYEIQFTTGANRPPILPASDTPLIGVGDLLRYNASVPRPVMPGWPASFLDLTGDGRADLIGTWNYGRRPGDRWDGPIVFPRTGSASGFEFGDMFRIYEVPDVRYSRVDAGDFDADGQPDLLFAPSNSPTMALYHNTGRRHATLMPAFEASGTVARPSGSGWNVRVFDLDRDGAPDIVAAAGFPNPENGKTDSTVFLKNVGGKTWPPRFEPVGDLKLAGVTPTFFDIDADQLPDAVLLIADPADPGLSGFRVAWQKNKGGSPPVFAPPQRLPEVDKIAWRPFDLASTDRGPEACLMVQYSNGEKLAFFTRATAKGPPWLRFAGVAGSVSAEIAQGDQAWPYMLDWDDDGDWDLLIGGGYGWPRLLVNAGTNARPAFSEAQLLESEGKPIRLLRDVILGQPHHWHNMGYTYPACVDWDGDRLPDLLLPNETNRIFWYRNIGTRKEPRFGPQQQLLVDGYSESPALRRQSAERALTAVYPKEQEQPFFWRTGAAFADFNGDGLMDMATHDGATRRLTLFSQYKDAAGHLRLKKDRPLLLVDGRAVEESVVGRSSGWTESFKAIDWNRDGLVDVVYSLAGKGGDTVYLLKNAGTAQNAVFAAPEPVRLFGQPIQITAHGPQVGVADLDGDGRPEVIGCTEASVFAFYRGTALAMSQRPTYTLGEVRPAGPSAASAK